MKWSIRLGTVAGIGVFVHVTFFALLAWVGYIYWQAEQSVVAALVGVAFILVLFTCVVLHEFGHALTAARYGVRTRDITLLPIGGIARLERMPEQPVQELLVALAGPAVNVAIAAVLYGLLAATGSLTPMEPESVVSGPFLQRLMLVNILLVVFNMLPAFPMDGGRVLRALLAMRIGHARATRIAATVGQGMAVLFGIAGLFGNPVLLIIALFVWIGAGQEAAATQMRAALGGFRVEHAMVTDFRTLAPRETLGDAVKLLLAGAQRDFPVVEGDAVAGGVVVGLLTRAELLQALGRKADGEEVASVMLRDYESAPPSAGLDAATERLQRRGHSTMLVISSGRLVGLLTLENVAEFVAVEGARRGGP
jgi:Zn-dependent protease/CBS domain-containing protein